MTAFKFILCSALVGIILLNQNFDVPAAALPSFAFIFVVYGAMILWELRKLLPPMSHDAAPAASTRPVRLEPVRVAMPRPSSQTRSSTA